MRNLTNEHKVLHQEIPSKFQKQQFFFTFVGKMGENSLKDRKILYYKDSHKLERTCFDSFSYDEPITML